MRERVVTGIRVLPRLVRQSLQRWRAKSQHEVHVWIEIGRRRSADREMVQAPPRLVQHVREITTDNVDVLDNQLRNPKFVRNTAGRWDHVQLHVG